MASRSDSFIMYLIPFLAVEMPQIEKVPPRLLTKDQLKFYESVMKNEVIVDVRKLKQVEEGDDPMRVLLLSAPARDGGTIPLPRLREYQSSVSLVAVRGVNANGDQ